MKSKAKVLFAELCFDALPIAETSDVFERVEHETNDGSRQVTFVCDDIDFPCRRTKHGCTLESFEAYFRSRVEDRLGKEILRLEGLGSFPRLSLSLAYGNAHSRRLCGFSEYCEVSREMIGALAERGMSLGMSYVTVGHEEWAEIPASFVKLLAKYHLALAF